jgi:tetratricopeptide (TPR) repeat protein
MQDWHPTNPVERRLMAAHEDWLCFANDKSARLLYWHTNPADVELLKVFFQGQRELSNAVLELNTPFENADQYPTALACEVIRFYEARREGSARSGVVADWQAPAKSGLQAVRFLFEVLSSLMQHHPDVFPGMVLVLAPERISKPKAFEACLDTLLTSLCGHYAELSHRLRLTLYGIESRALDALAQRQPHAVRKIHGRYQMDALPRELAAQSGERGTSGQFRRLFVELSESLPHEDPARLERLRAAALKVSDGCQWFDQSAIVHLLAGAAYVKWGDAERALNAYREAAASGQQARTVANPAGNMLVVNGLFGEASVQIMREHYRDAARCYADAAPYAHAGNDFIMLVEAYRMQAWCLDRKHERAAALDAGFRALHAGEGIEPALRANSNVQLAVAWMLERIDWLHARRRQLERALQALYGADWKQTVQPLPPADVSAQLIAHDKNNDKSEA